MDIDAGCYNDSTMTMAMGPWVNPACDPSKGEGPCTLLAHQIIV